MIEYEQKRWRMLPFLTLSDEFLINSLEPTPKKNKHFEGVFHQYFEGVCYSYSNKNSVVDINLRTC
jgi:hypothetical protein